MVDPRLPFPPLELAGRVGSLEASDSPLEYYDQLGRNTRNEIVDSLPDGWTFQGKRVLDFGCGAGRTLRHFLAEARDAEVWGCDIDQASIGWVSEHLSPPFHAFVSEPEPPLNRPEASFDLIWGISVFTHLTDSWSRWLAELNRILREDGLLFLTFMGRGMYELLTGEQWCESKVGMNVTKCGQSWDLGGPMVMHSPWWIEQHWGSGFDVVSIVPDGFATSTSVGQGSVLMRKRQRTIDPKDLERVTPGEKREMLAFRHNIDQLQRECVTLRRERAWLDSSREDGVQTVRRLEGDVAELSRRLGTLENSRSWSLTRPLRGLAQRIRAVRG